MEAAMKKLSSNKVFGGEHAQYSHYSEANKCDMTFAIFFTADSLG